MTDDQIDMENSKNLSDERLGKIQITLEEILQQLKQQQRMALHQDFSYTKLIGAIAQLLVVGVLFWVVVGLADIGDISGPSATMLKLLGATLLQMVALTFFILSHHEH